MKKIISFFKSIKYFSESETRDNFYLLLKEVVKEFPYGMMFIYNNIEFYVKEYSSSKTVKKQLSKLDDCVYIWCEYFDLDKKEFVEKSFHEEFLRNRIKVLKAINKD